MVEPDPIKHVLLFTVAGFTDYGLIVQAVPNADKFFKVGTFRVEVGTFRVEVGGFREGPESSNLVIV